MALPWAARDDVAGWSPKEVATGQKGKASLHEAPAHETGDVPGVLLELLWRTDRVLEHRPRAEARARGSVVLFFVREYT